MIHLLRCVVFLCLFLESFADDVEEEVGVGSCALSYNKPCDSRLIKFKLFSKGITGTNLDPFRTVLPSTFDATSPIKVLIHGYGGLALNVAIRNITNAYRSAGENIIVVDWSGLSRLFCYPLVYMNTWHVGQCLAVLAVSLIPSGVTPDMLHLVGFSLGAHVASFASNHLRKTLGTPVGRITGLDPALPLYATWSKDWKLDESDADFVDAIHTSAGSFGKIERVGHVDFYVNGGFSQPACANRTYRLLCSHGMAPLYFAESISGNSKFVGVYCRSMTSYNFGLCDTRNGERAVMGEYVDHSKRGMFFVTTGNRPPYALGDNVL